MQGKTLKGKLTRIHYQQPRGRSGLEIFKNCEDALVGAGMEGLFSCADTECGPAYAASKWNRFNGITTKTGAECRYLAGRMDAGGAEIYVSVMVG